jgi:glycosyltransferase involved in cell wall biosynthesis
MELPYNLPRQDTEELTSPACPSNGNRPLVLHTRVVTGAGGGPDKTILNSPRFLEPYGYEVICAYMRPPQDPGFEELCRKAESLGACLVGVSDRGPLDVGVAREMLRLCPKDRTIIWHGHDYKSNALGLLLRQFRPMRLVSTVHGWVTFTPRTPLYYWIDRMCLRHYERVICVSDDLRGRCLEAGVRPERCVVIENAIDTEQYARRNSPADARRLQGLRPEGLLVGTVGRLSAEKNIGVLVRSIDRLLTEDADVGLAIIGDGPERGPLETLIGDLGRSDRIRLLGYQADTAALYEAMDVFALASVREGLPNVLLEAMAMETPVIATQIAGIPRLVEDGTSGLLVPPSDPESLTDALRRLIRCEELRRQLAVAGRETIRQRYSFEVRMEKIRAVYDGLLAEKPARRE